jgi:hypothetical protein
MNNSEARLILQAYRPGGEDASDSLMTAALAQAQQDPELQKWLAGEQVLDARIQGQLRAALPIPADLKANLLALSKMAPTRARWRQPAWLAWAAAVALLLGLSAVWLRPTGPRPLDSFRQAMVGYSQQTHDHVAFQAPALAQIQQWLRRQDMRADFILPAGLRGLAANGCRVVSWHGQKAALICFTLPGGQHLDFFVLEATRLPGLAANGAPQYAQAGTEMTAAWSQGGRVYLLAGGGNRQLLASLLHDS